MKETGWWTCEELAMFAGRYRGATARKAMRLAMRRRLGQGLPVPGWAIAREYCALNIPAVAYAEPVETLPARYLEAAARGHVVLVSLSLPVAAGGQSWWCLDSCETHAPRAVRICDGSVLTADWDTIDAWWDGHVVLCREVLPDWAIDPPEVIPHG